MLKTLRTMPKGVTPLYLMQAFTTFTFAILYSSLALYLTQQLGLSHTSATNIVSLFLAFNFVLHLFGGLIGGSLLSNRTLFLLTNIMQCIAMLLLTIKNNTGLYLSLSLYLTGCGLNTTCYNSMLSQRFEADDNRRETAFFASYSWMNLGFLGGFFLSGFYDYSNNYSQLFLIGFFVNALVPLLMVYYWPQLKDTNTSLEKTEVPAHRHYKQSIGHCLLLIMIPIVMLCFRSAHISNSLVVLISFVMFFVILGLAFRQKNETDKDRLITYLILTITSILFWMIYYTGPMGITLFIKNNVDRTIFNYNLATQWFSNLNSIIIIVGAPLLAWLIRTLQNKGYQLTESNQFIWAFLFLSLSFFLLATGTHFANSQGYVPFYWVIFHILTQGIAELLIGPVGYAMIGRIAPPRLQGLLMGTWMMVSGVSVALSHYFSNAMVKSNAINPLITNQDYAKVFNHLGLWAILGGVFLYLIANRFKTHARHNIETLTN